MRSLWHYKLYRHLGFKVRWTMDKNVRPYNWDLIRKSLVADVIWIKISEWLQRWRFNDVWNHIVKVKQSDINFQQPTHIRDVRTIVMITSHLQQWVIYSDIKEFIQKRIYLYVKFVKWNFDIVESWVLCFNSLKYDEWKNNQLEGFSWTLFNNQCYCII